MSDDDYTYDENLHVLPIGDLREHDEHVSCWCRPKIEEHVDGLLVVHNALDGRERSEPDFNPADGETVQ